MAQPGSRSIRPRSDTILLGASPRAVELAAAYRRSSWRLPKTASLRAATDGPDDAVAKDPLSVVRVVVFDGVDDDAGDPRVTIFAVDVDDPVRVIEEDLDVVPRFG